MENLNISEWKKNYLNESATHFFRIRYTAPKGWYGDAKEVIKTNMHFAPDNIVSDYEITYEGTDSENENYLIKIYSNVDKQTLQIYLDGHSTRVEKYVVL